MRLSNDANASADSLTGVSRSLEAQVVWTNEKTHTPFSAKTVILQRRVLQLRHAIPLPNAALKQEDRVDPIVIEGVLETLILEPGTELSL